MDDENGNNQRLAKVGRKSVCELNFVGRKIISNLANDLINLDAK